MPYQLVTLGSVFVIPYLLKSMKAHLNGYRLSLFLSNVHARYFNVDKKAHELLENDDAKQEVKAELKWTTETFLSSLNKFILEGKNWTSSTQGSSESFAVESANAARAKRTFFTTCWQIALNKLLGSYKTPQSSRNRPRERARKEGTKMRENLVKGSKGRGFDELSL